MRNSIWKEVIKEKISVFYLNVASKVPKFQGGWIARMQDIRQRQIEEAREYFDKSKRPEDNDLSLHSIYLFEIFFLENFAKLEEGLDKIYMKGKKRYNSQRNIESYKEFMKRATEPFSSGAWINLFAIIPEEKKSKYLAAFARAYLPDFPEEIEYINIELFHILPSVICVGFDVKIVKDVNKDLDNMINRIHFSKLVFSSFFPWGRRFGWTSTSCSTEKRKAIYNYLLSVQIKAERFLSKYFEGYFLSQSHFSTPCCPSTEVFSISELPEPKEIENKYRQTREFWYSLGFEWFYVSDIFVDKILYFFNVIFSLGFKSPFRLLLIKKTLKTEMYGSIEGAISCESSYFIREFVNSILFIEICKRMLETLGKLRLAVGKNIRSRLRMGRFGKLLLLEQEVSRNDYAFNRLLSEYSLLKDEFKIWKRDQRDIVTLQSIVKDSHNSKTVVRLSDYFIEIIDRYVILLKKQYKIIGDSLRTYIEGRNIAVSYKLQKWIVILTIVLVLGLIPNEVWIKIINLLDTVIDHILNAMGKK